MQYCIKGKPLIWGLEPHIGVPYIKYQDPHVLQESHVSLSDILVPQNGTALMCHLFGVQCIVCIIISYVYIVNSTNK